MKVLQLNVRASQGGAGRVALDLHHRLRKAGIDSRLLYGYGSGITDDPMVAGEESVERIGTRSSVLLNYACHWAFGFDTVTGSKELVRAAIASTDIVHLHATHHHFIQWDHLINLIRGYRKPIVATAHDWWFMTGRCGFTEGCEEWKLGCGKCGLRRFRDPKSLFDFSRNLRRRKIDSIESLGGGFRFICPARHLASDYQIAFPNASIRVIPNCLDMEFERALSETNDQIRARKGIVFSAADLSSDVKIDKLLVKELARRREVQLILVGRNNPLTGDGLEICGEVRERLKMVEILRRARALVFCSRTDISPLTIIEALSAGCFVLAYTSAASEEILSKVGGSCIPDRDAMINVIVKDEIDRLYGGIDSVELARRAQNAFSGDHWMNAYVESYTEAMLLSK